MGPSSADSPPNASFLGPDRNSNITDKPSLSHGCAGASLIRRSWKVQLLASVASPLQPAPQTSRLCEGTDTRLLSLGTVGALTEYLWPAQRQVPERTLLSKAQPLLEQLKGK